MLVTLRQLISSYLDKTSEEIADILNAKNIQIVDTTLYTFAGLSIRLGTVAVAGLRSAVVAISDVGPLICDMLIHPGIDFSSDETRGMIDQLQGSIGTENAAILKAIGIKLISLYENSGFEGDVTSEEIEPILSDLIIRRDAGAYWSRVLEIVNPMIDSGETAAAIKAATVEVT